MFSEVSDFIISISFHTLMFSSLFSVCVIYVKFGLSVAALFQELSNTLKSESGKLYGVKCDVTKESDVKTAFKWVESNLGGVDILVNNAGADSTNSLLGTATCLYNSTYYLNLNLLIPVRINLLFYLFFHSRPIQYFYVSFL